MIHIPFGLWFSSHLLVGGDWRFFWPENLKEILTYAKGWDSSLNTGIGQSNFPIIWLNTYLAVLAHFLTQILHIPWNISEKIMFFWPILFLSFFSAFFLAKKHIKNILLQMLSGIIYLINTYSLMVFGGGQVGIALAYALAPFVFLAYTNMLEIVDSKKITKEHIRLFLVAGLVSSVQILIEPRIFSITAVAIFLYVLFQFLFESKKKAVFLKKIFTFYFLIPGGVILLLHSFWLLPILFFKINPVEQFSQSFTSSGLTKFFSFAQLENSLSLLHPNWPENIFGKIYFMRPEFLVLPFVAFLGLLFVKKENQQDKTFLFFAFLGILGTFLAKGGNPPFGYWYLWAIDHVRVFSIVRDPTKWYLLIALSYAILIPWSLEKIIEHTGQKVRVLKFFIPVAFALFYFVFLLRPLFLDQLNGAFKEHQIPNEYSELRSFINNQPTFFRTLWIPQRQRFGFFSNNHPAISSDSMFGSNDAAVIIKKLSNGDEEKILQELSVKYIVVPYDAEGEMFVSDRKYDDKKYQNTIEQLSKTSWIKSVEKFGKIVVFEIPNPKDHFWMSSSALPYKKISTTDYVVSSKEAGIFYFSEGFDRNWVAKTKGTQISSKRYKDMNSFELKEPSSDIAVSYEPQRLVDSGYVISVASLLVLFASLFLLRKEKMVQ